MPDKSQYRHGPVQGFRIKVGACEFSVWLPMRKDGSFDLYLDRENSDLECLTIDQITWLRHQAAGDDVVLISHFADTKLDKAAKRAAQERFGQWLQQTLGLPWTPGASADWEELESFF